MSSLTWRIYPDELLDRAQVTASNALQACAEALYIESQSRVPVVTGRLQASGFVEADAPDEVLVGYTAEYAPEVEFGGPHNVARGFLSGAAADLESSYESLAANEAAQTFPTGFLRRAPGTPPPKPFLGGP